MKPVVAASPRGSAPYAQASHAVDALRRGLWVVLFHPRHRESPYWALRIRPRESFSARGSYLAQREIDLHQGDERVPIDRAHPALLEQLRLGYHFAGGYHMLPEFGPGRPPEWLWHQRDQCPRDWRRFASRWAVRSGRGPFR